ncbi:MAG: hypothetical protein GY748_17815 [Planctomycetaceae bacterium]|nr:hypothetical protein [Planctomycetaceae bacterium]
MKTLKIIIDRCNEYNVYLKFAKTWMQICCSREGTMGQGTELVAPDGDGASCDTVNGVIVQRNTLFTENAVQPRYMHQHFRESRSRVSVENAPGRRGMDLGRGWCSWNIER